MIMTPEAWTVIGTGIALAAIIIAAFASLRNDVRELRERMARLEGFLDGLREAVTGRKVA